MRFPHAVIIRAPGLLPMLYTPTELEEDLRVPARTVREWIQEGDAAPARCSGTHSDRWKAICGVGEITSEGMRKPATGR